MIWVPSVATATAPPKNESETDPTRRKYQGILAHVADLAFRTLKAEQQSRNQGYGKWCVWMLNSSAILRMVAAVMPVVRKVTTAAIERREARARPKTPWPLVHPEPILVPNPNLAQTVSSQDEVTVTIGQ